MKFTILVEEVCSSRFEVEAETPSAALSKALLDYKSGTCILEPRDPQQTTIAVADNKGRYLNVERIE